jgi:thiamine biosynthesis protein ThiS
MNKTIEIMVNDLKETAPEGFSMSNLITYLDEKDVHFVVELNGRFVYSQEYDSTTLYEGDSIELINPDFGG